MTNRHLLYLAGASALALAVPAAASAACTPGDGIVATSTTSPVTITSTTGLIVNACGNGVRAASPSTINITLTNGSITGGSDGLVTTESGAGVTTINLTDTIYGGTNGVEATGSGAGAINITAGGNVTGQLGQGLRAVQGGAGAVTINTGAGTDVTTLNPSSSYGVYASSGSGNVIVYLQGGSSAGGIYASSTGGAGLVRVDNYGAVANTVGAGVYARSGTGGLIVEAHAAITATTGAGIDAASGDSAVGGAAEFVSVDAGSTVTGTTGVKFVATGNVGPQLNNSGSIVGSSGNGVNFTATSGAADVQNLAGGSIIAGGATAATAAVSAATSAGGHVFVTNAGLIQTTTALDAGLALNLSSTSLIQITNNGTLLGRVTATDHVTAVNTGFWRSSGISNFGTAAGAAGNVFTNTGQLIVGQPGSAPSTALSANFQNLGRFNNGASSVTGQIIMANGLAGDSLTLSGQFAAATGHSSLYIDASLAGPGSVADVLRLSGLVSGVTLIRINDVNTGSGAVNASGILVVANAGAATNWAIDPATTHYNATYHGVEHGLYLFTLANISGDEKLVGGLGPMALRVSTLSTAALQIFSAVDAVPAALLGQGSRAGFASSPDGADGPRVWMQATNWSPSRLNAGRPGLFGAGLAEQRAGGDLASMDGLGQTSIGGGATTYGLGAGFAQRTAALVTGADMVRRGRGDRQWVLGLSGGYVESDQAFASAADVVRYDGAMAGLYSALNDGNLSLKGSLRVNALKARYLGDQGGGEAPSTAIRSVGLQMDAAWSHRLGGSWTLQPLATLSAVRTSVDDLRVGGDTVRFADASSLRAGLGAQLTSAFKLGGYQVNLSGTTRVWDEMDGRAHIGVSALPDLPLADQVAGVSTEVGGRMDVLKLDGRTTAFVGGGYRFNASYRAATASAGLRLLW
jgi:hypothetical protein